MIRALLVAAITLACVASNAEARQRHKPLIASDQCNLSGPNSMPCEGVAASARGEYIARSGFGSAQKVYRQHVSDVGAAVVAHPSGCPARAFCGCGAAVRLFGSPIRSLWLAANWFKFPRAAPAPGMAAVRQHHVFVLEADLGGGVWQVFDANSGGHQTRIHARSIAGYTIVNPRGGAA